MFPFATKFVVTKIKNQTLLCEQQSLENAQINPLKCLAEEK
jgi:hypothetical protein